MIYMNISLKLTPFVSEQYTVEENYLRIPVLFTYEDRDMLFTQTITDGLPIIGKPLPEISGLTYFIGDNCSIEQLTAFIHNLIRGLPSNITFSETDDTINAIEYDPSTDIWKHRTGSKTSNCGSTTSIRLTRESLKQFREAFEGYRRFAFMQIEGHKMLSQNSLD